MNHIDESNRSRQFLMTEKYLKLLGILYFDCLNFPVLHCPIWQLSSGTYSSRKSDVLENTVSARYGVQCQMFSELSLQ